MALGSLAKVGAVSVSARVGVALDVAHSFLAEVGVALLPMLRSSSFLSLASLATLSRSWSTEACCSFSLHSLLASCSITAPPEAGSVACSCGAVVYRRHSFDLLVCPDSPQALHFLFVEPVELVWSLLLLDLDFSPPVAPGFSAGVVVALYLSDGMGMALGILAGVGVALGFSDGYGVGMIHSFLAEMGVALLEFVPEFS